MPTWSLPRNATGPDGPPSANGDVDVHPSQVEGCRPGTGVAMTSLRRRGNWLELRLVAESRRHTALVGTADTPVTAARICDLLGREGKPCRGGRCAPVADATGQIVTVQLKVCLRRQEVLAKPCGWGASSTNSWAQVRGWWQPDLPVGLVGLKVPTAIELIAQVNLEHVPRGRTRGSSDVGAAVVLLRRVTQAAWGFDPPPQLLGRPYSPADLPWHGDRQTGLWITEEATGDRVVSRCPITESGSPWPRWVHLSGTQTRAGGTSRAR